MRQFAMTGFNFSHLLLLSFLTIAFSEKYCNEWQRNQMHKIYTNCTEKYYQEFENSKADDDDPREKYCKLFSHLVTDCGDTWNYCHDAAEVADMKDMQVQSFYNHYDAFYVDDCDVVRKYNDKPFSRPERCSEEEQVLAQNLFNKCSHKISSSVYNNIQNMSKESMVSKLLCKGLADIEHSCSNHLTGCLSRKDSSHILQLHLKEIRQFFNTFLQDLIPNARLTSCENLNLQITGKKDRIDERLYQQSTVDATKGDHDDAINNRKTESNEINNTSILSYLENLYSTHMDEFDMNQDRKHDWDSSIIQAHKQTKTEIAADITVDKKEMSNADILDTDTDQREKSEVNEETNKPIKSSESRVANEEILNIMNQVVDNVSNQLDHQLLNLDKEQQPRASKEKGDDKLENNDFKYSPQTTDDLEATEKVDRERTSLASSSQSQTDDLQQKEGDKGEEDINQNNETMKNEISDISGTEKETTSIEDKTQTSSEETNNENKNETENTDTEGFQSPAENLYGNLSTSKENQTLLPETDRQKKPSNHEESNEIVTSPGKKSNGEIKTPAYSNGQYGWATWNITDKKIVINEENPQITNDLQEGGPSGERLVSSANKDSEKKGNEADNPGPDEDSSSSVRCFSNLWVAFLILLVIW